MYVRSGAMSHPTNQHPGWDESNQAISQTKHHIAKSTKSREHVPTRDQSSLSLSPHTHTHTPPPPHHPYPHPHPHPMSESNCSTARLMTAML